ncbi:anhydro-N-acetylmuramic acid kinase [bacterium]|nr:MAG: anhydro-N-acetylmuramic acid kinase [bacterium]
MVVGLMAGTSLDGIDVAVVELRPRGPSYSVELLRFQTIPYERTLERRLRAALPPQSASAREVCELHADVGAAFGDAAASVAEGVEIAFAASHGQTLYHCGRRAGRGGATLQIGDAFAIRERVGVTVAYDFRSADCAAGGEGAPLVPYADALLLRRPGLPRVALNLGGIANLTLIPGDGGEVSAFDVGPGNLLLDELARTRLGQPFDRDGTAAARGRADTALVERVLADPWFAQPPPKSTGRERFGAHALDGAWDALTAEDALATAVEITARSVAAAIGRSGYESCDVLVSGGGVHNRVLLAAIARATAVEVRSSACAGIDPDAKEAIAFAVLGYELLRGRPAGLPRVTGAVGPRLLGALAPQGLETLLARVRAEVGAA